MIRKAPVIPGGAGGGGGGGGGGALWPPNFWPTTLFGVFSHTTDRKVPSEVVLMGVFLCQSYMVMSDKTAIFQLKVSRIMILFFYKFTRGLLQCPA